MRVYRDWGICSREEHDLLVKIYHDQRSNCTKVKTKAIEYSIKPPVLKARDVRGPFRNEQKNRSKV